MRDFGIYDSKLMILLVFARAFAAAGVPGLHRRFHGRVLLR